MGYATLGDDATLHQSPDLTNQCARSLEIISVKRIPELLNNAAKLLQMLVEAYSGNALSRTQCYIWFEKFQNGDFDVRNEELGRPSKNFEDVELQALLDEDDGQTRKNILQNN
ncbi:hypothetical protein TNCV_697561 [Trichonephila clavipes]|nr:hypothetical protein TNCV_697561 [Trichonephila clavipes]